MPNELDNFLSDIKEEPKDPFAQEEKVEEVKVETEEKSEEKPLPFHKDPKVQRFIDKEIEKRLNNVRPSETERFSKETEDSSDEITDVLTRIIGNDTPERLSAIKDFKKVLLEREERGAQKALEQIQLREQEERQAEEDAQEELTKGFEEVEENFNVDLTSNTAQAKKERIEFVDFITRVAPKDENGDVTQFPDLIETYTLFKETKKAPTPSRAKELAARGLSRSTDASNAPVTGDRSWNAVDKLFSKFGN